MKKRILLMIVFGLSFAPAVFAEDTAARTGEQKLSETGFGASHCTGKFNEDKFYPSENRDLIRDSEFPGKSRSSSAKG